MVADLDPGLKASDRERDQLVIEKRVEAQCSGSIEQATTAVADLDEAGA